MQLYKEQFPNLLTLPTPISRSSLSRASRRVASGIADKVEIDNTDQTLCFDMKQYINLYGKKNMVYLFCLKINNFT